MFLDEYAIKCLKYEVNLAKSDFLEFKDFLKIIVCKVQY